MRFVARVYPSENVVVIVREDGKVRTVSLNLWRAYLSKCESYGVAYLCRRAAMVSGGDIVVGIVTEEPPKPEDLDRIRPLLNNFGIPEFALEDLVALMYSRDELEDLSCVGCREGRALLAASAVPA